jgi:hypothetical protein
MIWRRFILIFVIGMMGICLGGCCGDCERPDIVELAPPLVDHAIPASQYLANRFFVVDLPAGSDVMIMDAPGRDPALEFVDPASIQVHQLIVGLPAQAGDVAGVATFLDSSGRWTTRDLDPDGDGQVDDYLHGSLWRPLPCEIMLDDQGRFRALDLGRELAASAVLAVVYDVIGQQGELLYEVGDDPLIDADQRNTIDGALYYKMKLLKPPQPEPVTFQYVLRNVYDLGRDYIPWDRFDLRIEFFDLSLDHPELDSSALSYIRIFGLDSQNRLGAPGADGFPDIHDPRFIDLQRGLLTLPLLRPFDSSANQYAALADTAAFVWEESRLREHRAPQIYDWQTNPNAYPQFDHFRIVARYPAAEDASARADSLRSRRRRPR